MKKIILVIAVGFAFTAVCLAQTGTGEINRGIFHQEGIASWYGGEFNGRPTASGEIFNDTQLTAAHPILPFGTMLKVTNLHNNRSVAVRVNDRGPFVAARIIDVSRAAAQQLDMILTGTAPVKVESLHEVTLAGPQGYLAVQPPAVQPPAVQPAAQLPVQPGDTVQIRSASVETFSSVPPHIVQSTAQLNGVRFSPAVPGYPTGKLYRIQVGAYRQPQYAVEAFEKLKNSGLNPAYERHGEYYRVVLAGLKQEDLTAISERLGIAGFREVLLREE